MPNIDTLLCPWLHHQNAWSTNSAERPRCGACDAELPWLKYCRSQEAEELIRAQPALRLLMTWRHGADGNLSGLLDESEAKQAAVDLGVKGAVLVRTDTKPADRDLEIVMPAKIGAPRERYLLVGPATAGVLKRFDPRMDILLPSFPLATPEEQVHLLRLWEIFAQLTIVRGADMMFTLAELDEQYGYRALALEDACTTRNAIAHPESTALSSSVVQTAILTLTTAIRDVRKSRELCYARPQEPNALAATPEQQER